MTAERIGAARLRAVLLVVPLTLLCMGLSTSDAVARNTVHVSTTDPAALGATKLADTLLGTPIGEYPFYTQPDGSWILSGPRRWVSGFLPGSCWYEYERTGDPMWARAALEREAPLARYDTDTGTHDLGFMLQCSYGNDYRLNGGDQAKAVLLAAARSLATRYNARVGMVRTLNTPSDFYVYNDTMINIGLLFWGADHGGPSSWRTMAASHARRTIADFLRFDGSSYHYVAYDETTGAVLKKGQGQGAFDESTWSRGQAWIIYGLTEAYRETDDDTFLEGVRRAGDYWALHIPDDLVPYWDFDAPGIPDAPRDSSAAAVAASAFMDLGRLDPDPSRRVFWTSLADKTIASLSSSAYLAADRSVQATLLHGTYFAPQGQADQGTSWGDYYFREALQRESEQVTRLFGPDRYTTAVRVSQVRFDHADTVFLASGEGYADALAASPLAGTLAAPILLTPKDLLPDRDVAEIERLGAKTVIIVGGDAAVGAPVAERLSRVPGIEVRRIAGTDRFATAVAMARHLASPRTVYLVNGMSPADALAVAPIAYRSGAVVLPVGGALTEQEAGYLYQARPSQVIAIGGAKAVSDAVLAAAARSAFAASGRIAGRDRYETACALARKAGDAPAESVGLVSGTGFADALVAGAMEGRSGGVILLATPTSLPESTVGFLRNACATDATITVLGGDRALSGHVVFLAQQALRRR